MKTTYAIASFLVAGAGAMGAGAALDLAHYAGSDTLLTVTKALISTVPITGITYVGGGSGAGETNMYSGKQQAAPMSRFFKAGGSTTTNNVCGSGGPGPLAAEGIVHSLDGLSFVANGPAVSQTGPNGTPGCKDLNDDGSGMDKMLTRGLRSDGDFTWTGFWASDPHNTNPGTHVGTDGCSYVTYNQNKVYVPGGKYTFLDWQDVLKVLLAGVVHPYVLFTPDPNGATVNPANSTVCAAGCPAGGAAGTCFCAGGQDAGLPPSEAPANLDAAVNAYDATNPVRWALIANFGSIFEDQADANCPSGQCKCIQHILRRDDWSGTTDTVVSALGLTSIPGNHSTDPFANSLQVTQPTTYPTGLPVLDPAYEQSWPPPTDQDFDPIRVVCKGDGSAAGDDIVCEGDGTLGVLLPVEPSSDLNQADAYPTALAGQPLVVGFGLAQWANQGPTPYTCPNGDIPLGGNNCLVPYVKTLGASGFANLVEKGTPPLQCLSPNGKAALPYLSVAGLCQTGEDARVYNKMVHTTVGSYQFGSNGMPIQSAFYRNWSNPFNLAGVPSCGLTDATQDIGCVVGSYQCAPGAQNHGAIIGYAGLLATLQAGAESMRLDGVLPNTTTVQAFSYPASRKLYFNTMVGFQNVAAPELDLAQAYANVAPHAGFLQGIITAQGFVNLPAAAPNGLAPYNAGNPYTEDLDEHANCGVVAANTDATALNGPTGIPVIHTTCGNGTVEPYERCDDSDAATGNGSAGSNCTKNCICGKGGVGTDGMCCYRFDVAGHAGVLWGTGVAGCPIVAYPVVNVDP